MSQIDNEKENVSTKKKNTDEEISESGSLQTTARTDIQPYTKVQPIVYVYCIPFPMYFPPYPPPFDPYGGQVQQKQDEKPFSPNGGMALAFGMTALGLHWGLLLPSPYNFFMALLTFMFAAFAMVFGVMSAGDMLKESENPEKTDKLGYTGLLLSCISIILGISWLIMSLFVLGW